MNKKDIRTYNPWLRNAIIVASSISILLFLALPSLALENLDEMEARKDRKSTNMFYSGESTSNEFLWQSQTLCYKDVTTGHEVWCMTNTDNATAYSGSEYGHQPWSADGKRFAIALDKQTAAFSHNSYYADEVWFTVDSDGANMRPRVGAPARIRTHAAYTNWSPIEPDVYYEFGRHYAGESGYDSNMLYKVIVMDTGVSSTPWIDYIVGNTSTERDMPKDAVCSDGKYVFATEFSEQGIAAYGNTIDRTLALPEYSLNVGLDDYWYNTGDVSDKADWHDEMFVGGGGNYWVYFLYTTGSWWRMRPWGTDGGQPNHTVDHSAPYVWFEGNASQTEIQPVNGNSGVKALSSRYFSHGVADRWGSHFAYCDIDNAAGVGPGTWNIDADKEAGYGGPIGCQYSSWNGFTDYITGSIDNDSIYYMKYDTRNSAKKTVYTHVSGSNGQFVKPGQSPDGTKTAYRSGFLQPTATNADVFFVVNEFPYPPEISQVSASNGSVGVRFDWRLNTSNPRGYTKRGWPNEYTDDPPPPRETKFFRLWRSADKSVWTPVKTVDANIFVRYNFSDGTWAASKYWEIIDEPGDGRWYYAVTSLEWSGLESHKLSNIYSITLSGGSGTGASDTGYPSDPGGDSRFYSTYNPSDKLTRYYNIYAEDGSTPTISQANRIASVSINVDRKYIDWLGKSDGSTQYLVTAVDYQGNESNAILPTRQVNKPASGMYTLTWAALGEAARFVIPTGLKPGN